MKHVIVLTLTSSIGLVSLFAVDLIDLYFLTLLNNQSVVAGLGFAASIMFFNMSFSIGLSIAMSATVSKALGAGENGRARALAQHNFIISIAITALVALITWCFSRQLLQVVGAAGDSLVFAQQYLHIILPSLPFLAIAMSGGALLRAMGAPNLSMFAMLTGAVVNVALDPLFIFVLNLGIEGAAIASVFARIAVAATAIGLIYFKYDFSTSFNFIAFLQNMKEIKRIAIPTVGTQLATPFANAYMTYEMAKFGESYIAGWTLTGRITPVVFGVIFALSAAVGPIYAQNFGAQNYLRVKRTLFDSAAFVTVYCTVAALSLYLSIEWVIHWFGARGDAASFMRYVAIWIGPAFAFYGFLFVANAAFNNLGYPLLSTLFNFSKASIGTVPFVLVGANVMGANGIFLGNTLGNFVFGLLALICCFYTIQKISHNKPVNS
jgi:putative MATE family efflux protein